MRFDFYFIVVYWGLCRLLIYIHISNSFMNLNFMHRFYPKLIEKCIVSKLERFQNV